MNCGEKERKTRLLKGLDRLRGAYIRELLSLEEALARAQNGDGKVPAANLPAYCPGSVKQGAAEINQQALTAL